MSNLRGSIEAERSRSAKRGRSRKAEWLAAHPCATCEAPTVRITGKAGTFSWSASWEVIDAQLANAITWCQDCLNDYRSRANERRNALARAKWAKGERTSASIKRSLAREASRAEAARDKAIKDRVVKARTSNKDQPVPLFTETYTCHECEDEPTFDRMVVFIRHQRNTHASQPTKRAT